MEQKINEIEKLLKQRVDALSLVKLFLSHVSSSIVMLDKNLNLLLWSRKFAQEFFKQNLTDFQGKPLKEVAPSVYNALQNKNVLKLSLDGEDFEGFIGINGDRRFFSYSVSPWIKEGSVCGIIASFNNITSEKILKDKLGIYESRLNLISSLAEEGIWIIDENEDTVAVNEKLCEILEINQEDIIGKKIYEFAADENWISNAREKVKNRKSGVSEVHDFMFKTKTGFVLCEIRTSPLFSDNNAYIGAIALISKIKIKTTEEN